MGVHIKRIEQNSGLVSIGQTVLIVMAFVACAASQAQALPESLGTADAFAVLAGSTVTNTGPSTLIGNLGVNPGTAITGFFGTVENDGPGNFIGTAHQADAVALQAQSDALTAYNVLAGLPSTDLTGQDLGLVGSLVPGVYSFTSSAQLTGTLTLNGQGLEHPLYVFQIGSELTTASDSVVALLNGADACNIFWVVGSSATLGERTDFVGSLIADQSISLNDAASVNGRLIALNAAVTLINNQIAIAECAVIPDAPDIGVSGPGGTVSDGSAAGVLNGTDFGTVFVGDLIEHTFTITNTGTGLLELGALDITGDFALIGLFPTSIGEGDSADFIVRMDTTTTGSKAGTITFDTNAPGGPFNFDLAGNVIPTEVGNGIPEPGAASLLLIGMLSLAGTRRKRE